MVHRQRILESRKKIFADLFFSVCADHFVSFNSKINIDLIPFPAQILKIMNQKINSAPVKN